jgi:hypothetical protein
MQYLLAGSTLGHLFKRARLYGVSDLFFGLFPVRKRLTRYFQRIPQGVHSVQVPGEQGLVSGQGVHPGKLVEDMTAITVGLATIGFGGLDQAV